MDIKICKCICVSKYAMSTLYTNTLALLGEMCLANILPRDLFFSCPSLLLPLLF